MSDKLPPHFLDLIADALLHSFWRKRSLRAFLRRMGIKDSFLATWHDDGETKRDFIYRLFPFLESTEPGRRVLREIARELSDQVKFPDLDNWEDSQAKKAHAAEAVRALKGYLAKQREEVETAGAQAEARKRAQELRVQRSRQRADLDHLQRSPRSARRPSRHSRSRLRFPEVVLRLGRILRAGGSPRTSTAGVRSMAR